ncbi:hypothetical protein [Pseudoalteromonas sp. Angola-7]|uniref:hypothetical protein n=1 Tax=Pseudoalteromonas sp. Angola-7 TaxID=3025336 RepID=UPI00235A23F1|nr:hypothetical protein [Pseudoalteromonas sp. Angola-7]MDC9530291.1 hypothetical protein [Pseudoalteromonas sp. Angola-7]
MKSKNRVIKVAKVLSKLMSDRDGIEVTVSGSGAWSCGGRINIPFGDFTDPDYVTMTHGYIDHEIGHEKHTDFNTKFKSNLHANLCNIFEDSRMEKLVGSEYPGAKQNLEKLVLLAIKKGLFGEPESSDDPLSLTLSYCLYKGRVLNVDNQSLDKYAEQALTYLKGVYSNSFIETLTEIVHKITSAKSTRDCSTMAWEVIELLKEANEEEEQSDGGQTDDEQSDGGQSDGGQSDDEQSGDAQSGDEQSDDEQSDGGQSDGGQSNDEQSGDEQSGDEQSDRGQSNDEQSDDGQSDDGQSDGSSDNTNGNKTSASEQDVSEQSSSLIRSVIEAIENDNVEVPDFHEMIADELRKDAENFEPSEDDSELSKIFSAALPVTNKCKMLGLPFHNPHLIPSAGKAVYRTLHRALIDETEEFNGFRNRGRKLSSKKLVGSTLGDDRIFKTPVVENDLSAAISILIDSSGSMSGDPQKVANAVALAMSKGLQSLQVSNEIGFYSSTMNLYIAKPFNEKHINPKRFEVCSDCYTPSGEAMKSALMRLYSQTEDKKCLFLVTDGEPSCKVSFQEALELAEILDIKIAVLGVGMERDNIPGLDDKHFTKVECVSELKSALSKIVKANVI